MICSASHSFTATIWKFLTQYPYEPVNNTYVCMLGPLTFRDVNATPHTLTRVGYGELVVHSISKVSNANGLKHTYRVYIVDRFIGVLCKEFPDCSCETATYRTNHAFRTKVSRKLRLF